MGTCQTPGARAELSSHKSGESQGLAVPGPCPSQGAFPRWSPKCLWSPQQVPGFTSMLETERRGDCVQGAHRMDVQSQAGYWGPMGGDMQSA